MMTPRPALPVWLLSHPSLSGYLCRCSSPPDRRLVGKNRRNADTTQQTTNTTTTHLHGARAGVAHGGGFRDASNTYTTVCMLDFLY